MNLEQARFNMIEQQIRPWEVLDPTVLDLLKLVPREEFVPAQHAGLAFADLEIPIGHGQSMLSPKLQARIVQSLDLRKTDRVLEIGTGTGYMTALLASLAGQVVSVDCVAQLTREARRNLRRHCIANVTLASGDAMRDWDGGGDTYDVIVLTGSVPQLPPALQRKLAIGGRLFAVVGEAPAMAATLVRRVTDDAFRSDVLFETCVPSLVNAPQPQRFSF
ncbi:MAG TPA: protein-L-isoaspartate O-methyltransferase [Methylophilaceae bacterium]|nr:protein-L-isoaspartate O-methyltransferase [Methylophilaceae bacterium]